MEYDEISKVSHTISVDMIREDYYPLKSLIQTKIDQKLIDNLKFREIKTIMAGILSSEQFNQYNCVFGLYPSYFLLSKKKSVWIFKMNKIAFFIYKAKPIDIPIYHAIENHVDKELISQGEKLAEKVLIKRIEGYQEDTLLINKMKNWIACHFIKNKKLREEDNSRFEIEFSKKFKMFLLAKFPQSYWHFFFCRRLGYILSKQDNNLNQKSMIEIELDFPEFSKYTYKPTILVFQRRIKHELNYFNKAFFLKKWREVVIFICLAVALFVFTNCPAGADNQMNMEEGLNKEICAFRGEICFFVAGIIFLLTIIGIIRKRRKKAISKNKKKQKTN